MDNPDGVPPLWKFYISLPGFKLGAHIPYYPGLVAEMLKAEIIDPLTLLVQKVLHVTEFVDEPFRDRNGRSNRTRANTEVSIRRLHERLKTMRVPRQPLPIRVTGTFSTAVLLSKGWWERTGPGANPVGRNDIQRWTYAGFEEWAPSWDFTSDVEHGDESFFLGQIGHGDEADSMLVVVVGERARAIRPRIVETMHDRAIGALSVEITGLLCHRNNLAQRNPQLAVFAKRLPKGFNYCLLLDDDHHHITRVDEVPDFYSAYLWKCLWAKDKASTTTFPKINDCYIIWEHTDLTKPGAIQYNLDSLQHKEDFLRKKYGAMELLQKSGPLITEAPSLRAGSFQRLFRTIGRTE